MLSPTMPQAEWSKSTGQTRKVAPRNMDENTDTVMYIWNPSTPVANTLCGDRDWKITQMLTCQQGWSTQVAETTREALPQHNSIPK